MPSSPPQARIARLIKAKRRETGLGLREAAKVAKISPATMSRLERGQSASLSDVGTLTKLSSWLGLTVSDLINEPAPDKTNTPPKVTTPEFVEVHLRADKNLTTEAAEALATMFKTIYNQVAKQHPAKH